MDAGMRPGTAMGRMIRARIVRFAAPSTRAASSRSLGMVLKKPISGLAPFSG
jgi:hypothetical protein